MNGPPHVWNWSAGWLLLLGAFVTGALVGLFFHRDDFWGGYGSFRRRIVRLGHISLAALGMVNLLYGLSPWPPISRWESTAAGVCWIVGGITMPSVCFLSGWQKPFRHLFFIPVTALICAAVLTLLGGLRAKQDHISGDTPNKQTLRKPEILRSRFFPEPAIS